MSLAELSRLVVLNMAVDGALLAAAARLGGGNCPARGVWAGAALGAAYTVMVFCRPGAYVTWPPLRLGAALGMVLLLTGGRRYGQVLLAFFLLCCTLAGGVLLVGGLTHRSISGVSGYPATAGDAELLLFCGAGLYLAAALWARRRSGGRVVPVLLRHRGRRVLLRVLEDTGCALRDPVSGKPVLIAEAEAAAPLFPAAAALLRGEAGKPVACLEALVRAGAAEGFSLLPYRALGTERGLLLCARIDEWEVNGRRDHNRMIALTDHDFGGRCQGLLGESGDEWAAFGGQRAEIGSAGKERK